MDTQKVTRLHYATNLLRYAMSIGGEAEIATWGGGWFISYVMYSERLAVDGESL